MALTTKHRRLVAAVAIGVLLPIGIGTLWTVRGAAAQGASPGLQVVVRPLVQHPSGSVAVVGSGFPDSSAVTVRFSGKAVGTAVADGTGRFSTDVTVPAWALPGKHTVSAVADGDTGRTTMLVRTNWPMANFGPRQRAANPYENVLSPSTVGQLSVKWQQTFDTSNNSAVYSAPSIINGYVYTSVYYDVNVPGYKLKLDASTGAIIWSSNAGYAQGPPVVYGGNVYWEDGGDVYVTSDATGQFVADFANTGGFDQEVLVGNILYTGTAAINLDNKGILWSGTPGGTRATSGFAYDNGMLFMGLEDTQSGADSIAALDASTGTLVWDTPENALIEQTPAVDNGRVLLSNRDGVTYALTETTGSQLWADSGISGGGGPPAALNGTVYQVGPAGAYALDETTGAVEWTNSQVYSGRSMFNAALANGVLYVAGDALTALDTATGSIIYSSLAYRDNGLAVANGNVYSSQDDGLGIVDYASS